MTQHSSEDIAEIRRSLLEWLEEKIREGHLENIVQYADVSRAFLGGPHEHSFDIRAIDQDTLKQWCSENGYEVSFAKNIDPKYLERGVPPLIFRKITKS